jgi:hypothetical protein
MIDEDHQPGQEGFPYAFFEVGFVFSFEQLALSQSACQVDQAGILGSLIRRRSQQCSGSSQTL